MKIKTLVITLLVAISLSVPMIAQAACGVTGEIVRAYETPSYSYFYVKTSPLATITYYFYVPDAQVRSALRTAYIGNKKVYMYGNATSCPTTSLAYGGTVTYTYLNP